MVSYTDFKGWHEHVADKQWSDSYSKKKYEC